VRELALAVRHGGGDAVHINAHAAHPEGGACAEAAHRQLQILRLVLPVARQYAGRQCQAFREVQLRPAVGPKPFAVDDVDGRRHLKWWQFGAGGGDGDRRERLGQRRGA
jgi:hypothetical protein